jgi:branched-chain amino acid transport system substrate-binding protein
MARVPAARPRLISKSTLRTRTLLRAFPAVVLAAAALLLPAGTASAQKLEFRVGFLVPLTGDLADLGASCQEGAKLAVERVNAAGGLVVGGRSYEVVLVTRDCQGRPETAVAMAQELINKERISAFIGPPTSGPAIPVAKLADKSRVPMITPAATNPDVTKGLSYVWRVCFTDDFQGEVMARFSRERLNASTAAVLYDVAGAYNRRIAEIFMAKFRESGGRIVAEETYTTGAVDFKAQLSRIKSRSPDILFLPNYAADLRMQLDQIRELKVTAQIVGTDTMSFRDAASTAKSEGAYSSSHFSIDAPDSKIQDFLGIYKKAFERTATPSGALTYDAFGLLFDAALRAGKTDAESVVAALRSTIRYEGVTGIMEFSGSPDPKKSVVIVRVRDAQPRFFARIDP